MRKATAKRWNIADQMERNADGGFLHTDEATYLLKHLRATSFSRCCSSGFIDCQIQWGIADGIKNRAERCQAYCNRLDKNLRNILKPQYMLKEDYSSVYKRLACVMHVMGNHFVSLFIDPSLKVAYVYDSILTPNDRSTFKLKVCLEQVSPHPSRAMDETSRSSGGTIDHFFRPRIGHGDDLFSEDARESRIEYPPSDDLEPLWNILYQIDMFAEVKRRVLWNARSNVSPVAIGLALLSGKLKSHPNTWTVKVLPHTEQQVNNDCLIFSFRAIEQYFECECPPLCDFYPDVTNEEAKAQRHSYADRIREDGAGLCCVDTVCPWHTPMRAFELLVRMHLFTVPYLTVYVVLHQCRHFVDGMFEDDIPIQERLEYIIALHLPRPEHVRRVVPSVIFVYSEDEVPRLQGDEKDAPWGVCILDCMCSECRPQFSAEYLNRQTLSPTTHAIFTYCGQASESDFCFLPESIASSYPLWDISIHSSYRSNLFESPPRIAREECIRQLEKFKVASHPLPHRLNLFTYGIAHMIEEIYE